MTAVNTYDPGPIPPFLDRVPMIYTYTNLNTYTDICPYQFQQRYVLKTTKYVATPEMKFGTEMHDAMDKRIGAGKPLPEQFRQWESFATPLDGLGGQTELKLACNRKGEPCDFWAKDVFIRVKADYVLSKPGNALLLDWKTSKKPRENPFELEVQAMLLRITKPHVHTIFGSYVWLAENRIGQQHDLSDTEATRRKVVNIVNRVENDLRRGQFEKRPGPLCGWCDCLECEHNRKRT